MKNSFREFLIEFPKREKLNLGEKVAVICEGGAETAIMEMLLVVFHGAGMGIY